MVDLALNIVVTVQVNHASDDYSSYFLKHVLTESLDILNTKYDEDKFMNEWVGQRFI